MKLTVNFIQERNLFCEMIKYSNEKKLIGFTLIEVLWGTFLLATAIVVIAGLLISALQACKKSEAMLQATNILIEEKGKIDKLGFKGLAAGNSYSDTVEPPFYFLYNVDGYDYGTGVTGNEIKTVHMVVYNVPPSEVSNTARDKLVSVKTNLVLYYKP